MAKVNPITPAPTVLTPAILLPAPVPNITAPVAPVLKNTTAPLVPLPAPVPNITAPVAPVVPVVPFNVF
jgi:hypothetical protein